MKAHRAVKLLAMIGYVTACSSSSTTTGVVGGTSSVSTSALGGNLPGGTSAIATMGAGGSTQAAGTGGASATGGGASNGGSSSSVKPSTGCGVTGSATDVQNLTIPIAGQDRGYVLFVPKTYSPSTAFPLIFAWHGLGGTGTMARQYFGIERATSNQAIIVYPSGLPNSDGQAGWTLTQDGIDVQFFDTLLSDVSAKYCIDSHRVYSTGHSFGALMTNALGCYRGNVLRAIAPVAGMPPFGNPTCKGPVAAWIAHGENDATVDFTSGGIASRDFWIKLDGCSASTNPVAVEPSPCVAYQGCSDGHAVHWCVHQDNHNWPSFAGAGIWAFFNALK